MQKINILTGITISSLPEVFYKAGARVIFSKLTGKHPCRSHFFNKVAGLCNFNLSQNRPPYHSK